MNLFNKHCNANEFFFGFMFTALKKQFETPPYPTRVEVDKQVEMRCIPPTGIPPPKVYWLRNNLPLDQADTNIILSNEGHLLISQARLQDTANYTCVAENIAAKRLSEPAMLTVYGKRLYLYLFSILRSMRLKKSCSYINFQFDSLHLKFLYF